MTATGLGSTLRDGRGTLDKVAGAVIIALGVFFLLTPFVPRLNREWRPGRADLARRLGRPADRRRGVRGRLDAVRRPDARRDPHRRRRSQDTVGKGAILLLFYSARPRRPVPAHRVAFTRATSAFRWLRDRYLIVTAVSGVVLIAMGLLLLTGELTRLNLEAQDALDSLGLNFFKSL